jgi:CDP-paratose 2-epimerase
LAGFAIDQGFIVLWMARHLFGGSLAYMGFGGEGLQVLDVLHVDLLAKQLAELDSHSAQTIYNVGGGIEKQCFTSRADRVMPGVLRKNC